MFHVERHDTFAKMIAKRVLFFGRVQGVGFRYTSLQLLKGMPLQGFVRNLSDGSVELWLQGERKLVEQGIERIRKHWHSNIDGFQEKEMAPDESLQSLQIV